MVKTVQKRFHNFRLNFADQVSGFLTIYDYDLDHTIRARTARHTQI